VSVNADVVKAGAQSCNQTLSAEGAAVGPGEEGIAGTWLWEPVEEVAERCHGAGKVSGGCERDSNPMPKGIRLGRGNAEVYTVG
jgi:hypothetical protein